MENNLTIFNVAVPMKDQPQCDRMKKLCIDYGLPYWGDEVAFSFDWSRNKNEEVFFEYVACEFYVTYGSTDKYKRTEQKFIELLNEYKSQKK